MSHHDTLTAAVLLDGPAAAGAVSVIEVALPPRWDGPPLHPPRLRRGLYVLDGELTFMVGHQLGEAGPGTMTFAPRGTHHTLANCADVPARYLLTHTPAGFERKSKRLAARVAGTEPDAEALEPFPETVVVGPTLFEHVGR